MNSVHISDIHFGKKNDKRLSKELLEEFLLPLNEMHKENKIDIVFLQGDLFDRVIKMDEVSATYVFKFIEKLTEFCFNNKIQLRIIKGTKGHDFNQLSSLSHFEKIFSSTLKIIKTVTTESILTEYSKELIDVLYLPEEYPVNPKEYYKPYFEEENKYDIVIGHGMIDIVRFGSKDQENELLMYAPVFDSKELIKISKGGVFFGHIHDYQEYKEKIYYTGSFSRFSFENQKEKGFLYNEYDKSTSKFNVYIIENEQAPKYKIIDFADYDGLSIDEKIKILNEAKDENDFIKIRALKDDDNISVLKEVVSIDSSIKMEIKNIVEEVKIDEKYRFILNRELPLDKTIQKFIKLKNNKLISLKDINNILKLEEKDN